MIVTINPRLLTMEAHLCWSHTKVVSEVQNQETKEEHTIDHSFDDDYADIASEASRRRISKGLSPMKDKVFVAVAWANKDKL